MSLIIILIVILLSGMRMAEKLPSSQRLKVRRNDFSEGWGWGWSEDGDGSGDGGESRDGVAFRIGVVVGIGMGMGVSKGNFDGMGWS